MQETYRTEISTLGEFGLIKHLTENIRLKNSSTRYGVGDDCAVMEYPADKQVLVTSDLLMEGIHFDLTYVPMKHLGYKAAMVNLSDIYAMNGTPRQMVVSIALGKRFCVEDMEAFYDGLKMACEAHEVDIVGGDTTSSLTGLAISQRQRGLSQRSQRNRLDLCQRRFRSSLHGIAVARTRKSRFQPTVAGSTQERKNKNSREIIRSPTGL